MIDRQQLKTIADQIETVGGWHIAALKIMEAADELDRLRGEHENISRGRLPTHRCKVCDTFWMELPEHNAMTMVGVRCGETCCEGANIEPLPIPAGLQRFTSSAGGDDVASSTQTRK